MRWHEERGGVGRVHPAISGGDRRGGAEDSTQLGRTITSATGRPDSGYLPEALRERQPFTAIIPAPPRRFHLWIFESGCGQCRPRPFQVRASGKAGCRPNRSDPGTNSNGAENGRRGQLLYGEPASSTRAARQDLDAADGGQGPGKKTHDFLASPPSGTYRQRDCIHPIDGTDHRRSRKRSHAPGGYDSGSPYKFKPPPRSEGSAPAKSF